MAHSPSSQTPDAGTQIWPSGHTIAVLRQNKSTPHESSVQLFPSSHSASVSQGVGELDTQPKPPLINMHGTIVQRHLRLLRLIIGPHGSSDPEAPTIPIYRTLRRHRSRPNHSNQTNTTCLALPRRLSLALWNRRFGILRNRLGPFTFTPGHDSTQRPVNTQFNARSLRVVLSVFALRVG